MLSFSGLTIYLALFGAQAQILPVFIPKVPTTIWRETDQAVEVQVTPARTIAKVAAEVDEAKQVLTVGLRYRGHEDNQDIRRAPIGIPLKSGFRVYIDSTSRDYDRLIFTHDKPQTQWTEVSLETLRRDTREPAQVTHAVSLPDRPSQKDLGQGKVKPKQPWGSDKMDDSYASSPFSTP